jgi:hypothetical protein
MTVLSEVGDKTFFAAAVHRLPTHRRFSYFLGSFLFSRSPVNDLPAGRPGIPAGFLNKVGIFLCERAVRRYASVAGGGRVFPSEIYYWVRGLLLGEARLG